MAAISSDQLQQTILNALDKDGSIQDTRELQLVNGQAIGPAHEDQMQVKAALDSLSVREMVTSTQNQVEKLALTQEGEQMASEGSHEYKVWAACPATMKDLQAKLGADVAKVGQLNAFKKKWIKKEGDGFAKAVRLAAMHCNWLYAETVGTSSSSNRLRTPSGYSYFSFSLEHRRTTRRPLTS